MERSTGPSWQQHEAGAMHIAAASRHVGEQVLKRCRELECEQNLHAKDQKA